MNEIKEKDALLVSFVQPITLKRLLFLLALSYKQKNMQKPSGEQIVNSGPDVAAGLRAELKQVNTQKRSTIEKIQEVDGEMKELAKDVTQKVKTDVDKN